MLSDDILNKAKKYSSNTCCHTKVVAIAFTKKKELLGFSTNRRRFFRKGGGIHAEQRLIKRYKNNIKYIYIFRFNKNGSKLSIHPCPICYKLSEKYDIKIISYNSDGSGTKFYDGHDYS